MAEVLNIKSDPSADRSGTDESLFNRDTLFNMVKGIGTKGDSLSQTRHVFRNPVTPLEAESLYLNDWLGAATIDAIPDDMTREWREVKGIDADKAEEYAGAERFYDVKGHMTKGLKWGRLYGGAGTILGIDGAGEMHEPLDVSRVRKGSLKWLTTLDRYHLVPERVGSFNPLTPDWDKPEFYRAFSGPDMIHRSRIMFFYGIPLPYRLAIRNWHWGGSILDRVVDSLRDAGIAQHGIAALILEAKVDVFKTPHLFRKLKTPQGEQEVTERFRLANAGKSFNNAIILDDSESWEQKTDALSQGLPQLLRQFLEVVSGASGIPVTRLLGVAPSGLGSNGEESTRNYYDRIKHNQETQLDPSLRLMDEVLTRSTWGEKPDKFESEYRSLWQQNETERATTQLQDAQRDQIYIDLGVIAPDHAGARLDVEQVYPTLDAAWVKALLGAQPDPDFETPDPVVPGAVDPAADPDKKPDDKDAPAPAKE